MELDAIFNQQLIIIKTMNSQKDPCLVVQFSKAAMRFVSTFTNEIFYWV